MPVALVLIGLLGIPAVLLPSVVIHTASGAARGELDPWLMIGGLVVGISVHNAARRRTTYRFLSTFHHELVHMLFAILLLAPPVSFTSSRDRGALQHEPPRGILRSTRTFLITIAPYWFSPLAWMPVLWCGLRLPDEWLPRFLLSAIAGLALVLPISQIHARQPDLTRYGLLPPVMAAVWLWAAQAVVVITVTGDWAVAAVPAIYASSLGAF